MDQPAEAQPVHSLAAAERMMRDELPRLEQQIRQLAEVAHEADLQTLLQLHSAWLLARESADHARDHAFSSQVDEGAIWQCRHSLRLWVERKVLTGRVRVARQRELVQAIQQGPSQKQLDLAVRILANLEHSQALGEAFLLYVQGDKDAAAPAPPTS
jgi:hypothetical protein